MNFKMIFNTLGRILLIEAALLLIPFILSFVYAENLYYVYLISMGIMVLIGLPLALFLKPEDNRLYSRDGFVLVGLCWVCLSLFGALPFFFSGAGIDGEFTSYINCFFETVSGFTTTGATILKDVEVIPHSLLLWRSFTHWIGGMGVLVFVLAILPNSSGQNIYLLKAESTGPQVGKLVSKITFTARILYIIYFVLTVVLVIFLLFGGNPLFDSVVLSLGTAGTGGFAILNDGLASYSDYTQIVIAIFMFLFGINFNIYYLILIGNFKQILKNEEMKWYGIVVLISTIIISFNIFGQYNDVFESIKHAFFQTTSIITTTGYGTTDFNTWPLLSKAILFILMFVGGCAGSTAGGVKVSRFVILFKSLKREFNKLIHPNSVEPIIIDEEPLDENIVRGVSNYFALIIAILFVGVFIVSFDGQDFETTFTAVTTCINNVGPGFNNAYSNMSVFGDVSKIFLSIAMLIGRLEIYPMLLLFMPKVWTEK